MKTRILLSALFFLALSVNIFSQDVISSKDAASHIGETLKVKGVVASIFVSGKGTVLINFDDKHPNETFVAVILQDSGVAYDDITEGCTLTVQGEIKDYKGKPEIVLNSRDQIISVEK